MGSTGSYFYMQNRSWGIWAAGSQIFMKFGSFFEDPGNTSLNDKNWGSNHTKIQYFNKT